MMMIIECFAPDVTATMLVYRTMAKKSFGNLNRFNIMQNLFGILILFCIPTWPSHHVSENTNL